MYSLIKAEIISLETLQAFNNAAAELKKEGGIRNHITLLEV